MTFCDTEHLAIPNDSGVPDERDVPPGSGLRNGAARLNERRSRPKRRSTTEQAAQHHRTTV
jgi:hypothetical protein